MAHIGTVRTAVAERRGRPGPAAPAPTPPGRRPAPRDGSRPRLYVLDGLRLLAALMVAVHHYIGTYRVNRPESSPWGRPVEEIFPNAFPVAAYGWLGVEFFFVISGFVICMSCWGKRPRDFFVSRVVRLYPAYWFAVLLTTAVLLRWPMQREPLPYGETLLNLTMLNEAMGVRGVDGVYWTLWSELRFYLLFLLLMAFGRLTYRRVVIFVGVWGFLAALAPRADSELLTLLVNPQAAWFFIAGLALYLMYRFGPDLLLWGILAMSWLMGQYQFLDRVAYESVSSWRGALLLYTAFLAFMAAIALGHVTRPRGRWLTVAGSLTYPFYLIHYAIGLTAIHLLHDTVNARLLLALLLVAGLAGSWLIHRGIERPAASLLRRELNRSLSRFDRLDRIDRPPAPQPGRSDGAAAA